MDSKYLKYALGEIVLVVIGILIALSISNWNEERKEKRSENQLLEKLKVENDFNLNILLEDSAYYAGINDKVIELYENLKKPKNSESDTIIASRINDILRISLIEFSKEYLNRYINNSKVSNDELVNEFIELKESFNSIEIASKIIYDYKIEKILGTLEESLDFYTGEITNMQKLRSQVFINRLQISSAIESSKIEMFDIGLIQAKKVDSLLSIRLNLNNK